MLKGKNKMQSPEEIKNEVNEVEQVYCFPELGVAVRAGSYGEALRIAKEKKVINKN